MELTQCKACNCMTKTIEGFCGKCKESKTMLKDGLEYVWNPKGYDYSSEMTITEQGTITYAVTGTWVLTAESCEKILTARDGGMK